MDPRAVLDESGKLVGWMFAPDPEELDTAAGFEGWQPMGFVGDD